MKTLRASLTRVQRNGLNRAYKSVKNGKEKVWISGNTGEAFDTVKEGNRFSESLKSKAVKKMEEKLSRIYAS